jgi:hypothetical protein
MRYNPNSIHYKYGIENQKYHKEILAFGRCHNRVRDGKVSFIEWPRDKEGFIQFLLAVGPIPETMEKPSIGRIDHSKGYIAGNIQWEEHRINSGKTIRTNYTNSKPHIPKFKRGTPEWIEHQREATMKRWSNPNARKEMSERMKGNNYNRFSQKG